MSDELRAATGRATASGIDQSATIGTRYPNSQPRRQTVSLITTIEDDLRTAGHEVSDILHGVLSKHLTLSSIATHVAADATAIEEAPLYQVVKRLPGGGYADMALHFLTELATLVEGHAAASTPAEPPADTPQAAAEPPAAAGAADWTPPAPEAAPAQPAGFQAGGVA